MKSALGLEHHFLGASGAGAGGVGARSSVINACPAPQRVLQQNLDDIAARPSFVRGDLVDTEVVLCSAMSGVDSSSHCRGI
jgi:hypothetical protein